MTLHYQVVTQIQTMTLLLGEMLRSRGHDNKVGPHLGVGPYYYKKLEGSLFEFAAIGKKSENYYIQWLKNRELVKYNVFYMSCKFL